MTTSNSTNLCTPRQKPSVKTMDAARVYSGADRHANGCRLRYRHNGYGPGGPLDIATVSTVIVKLRHGRIGR